MANSPSALKRARQNEVRRQRRSAQRAQVRTAIKRVRNLAEARQKDPAALSEAYRTAVKLLDRMAGKGTIPKGQADRNKSRLNALIKPIAVEASAATADA